MSHFEPKPFGKYFLIDRLAVGGMAEIYKAKTFGVDGFEKTLAIKKILPNYSADKEFIAMLTDEAKLVVRLSHTNIVQIYDLGKVGDDYYISMEFIDGLNLREFLNRAKELKEPVPIPICLYIISEVCKGLDYAHSKRDENSRPLNIVHRDVSPQNVLISFEGETKIVDFGIAKAAMNMSQTSAGILKGKVTYMSPEQALGKVVDHRTDVFSTGILLYEMLTGQRLFSGETQFHVLKQIQTSDITEESLPKTIPDDIRKVLAKALAADPDKRYETAGDFQIALTKILYSQYHDFSPKLLSQLVRRWFEPELKAKRKQAEVSSIDTATRALLKSSDQESLVKREQFADISKVQLLDTTKPEDSKEFGFRHSRPETELPLPRRHKKTALPLILAGAIFVITLAGYGAYSFLKHRHVKPAAEGTLIVSSDPDEAQIFINNTDTGETTPATLKKIPLNTAQNLKISKEGFEPWEKTVTLTNGNPTTVEATLKALPAPAGELSLLVKTNPPGASLTVNGKAIDGKTPLTLKELSEGKPVELVLTLADYQTLKKTIIPNEDMDEITLSLEEVEKATLDISSDPSGASIFIDGKDTGLKTPETVEGLLPAKTYRLLLKKDGYLDATKDIAIDVAGDHQYRLTLEKTVKPQAAAQVIVKSNVPGAVVFVNGKEAGKTPLTFEVAPGQVDVRVVKKDYIDARETVIIKEGETKNVILKLTREKEPVVIDKQIPDTPPVEKEKIGTGEVRIDSNPRGAAVTFDGRKAGVTPIVVRNVSNGSHSVTITRAGYRTYSRTINVTKGYLEITAPLEKE